MNSQILTDVAIIGAGPAGMSAAIQLSRFGVSFVVFEQNHIGGLAVNANKIENYLGFPSGISGRKFVSLLEEMAENFSVNIKYERVISVEFIKSLFVIRTKTETYRSKFVIVASGTKAKRFSGCDVSDKLADKIFYEIEELRDIDGNEVAIVGAGDAAFDYAVSLAERKNKVIIVNRSERIKALCVLRKKVLEYPNVTYKSNLTIEKIFSHNRGLVIETRDDNNKKHKIYADYLIFAIGREPQLDFLSLSAKRADGIYFCGDVCNRDFRQIAIASGEGLKAAMMIYDCLRKK